MKKTLPLSIISLAALVATPALAGNGHRGHGNSGDKVVDARLLQGEVNEAERSLQRLKSQLLRMCRRDCRAVKAELKTLDRSLDRMQRTLNKGQRVRTPNRTANNRPPARALSNIELTNLRRRLIADNHDSVRLQRLQRERPALTVHMTVAVLATMNYDASRLSAVSILSPYIVDPQNFTLIDSAFRNRSSRDRARATIASRARTGSGAYAQAPPPPATTGRGRRAP